MKDPSGSRGYPWSFGDAFVRAFEADVAHAEGLSSLAVSLAVAHVDAHGLRPLIDAAIGQGWRGIGAPPTIDPPPVDADIERVARWCAARLVSTEDAEVAVAIGVVCRTYGQYARIGLAVSSELGRRMAEGALDKLDPEHPEVDALAAMIAPVGGDEARELFMPLASAAMTAPAPTTSAASRFEMVLASAASAGLSPPLVIDNATGPDLRHELGRVLAAHAETWSWDLVRTWLDEDAMAFARTIARVAGLGAWVQALEDIAVTFKASLHGRVQAAWAHTLTTAREMLARGAPSDASAVAAADRITAATADIARRLGDAARSARAGVPCDVYALCVELLDEPRAIPRA